MIEEDNNTNKRADWLLITLFFLVLLVTGGWQVWKLFNSEWSDSTSALEEQVEQNNLASMKAKELVQSAKSSIDWRTDGVLMKDGVSYFVDDLQHLSKRAEYIEGELSPYHAIIDFRNQLANKNIELFIMIVDGKGFGKNEATNNLVSALSTEHMPTIHVSNETTGDYLKHDSHWRPELMERQVKRLTSLIEGRIKEFIKGKNVFEEQVCEITNKGDLVRSRFSSQKEETIQIRQVRKIVESSMPAKILLLGDSYSNIFSAPEMGWGESAGLAERLSFSLQSECEAITINGNGAHSSRNKLTRNPELLDGKQVVIWQFSARELDQQWNKITIPAKPQRQPDHIKLGYDDYKVLALPKWKKESAYPVSLTEVLLKRSHDDKEVLVRMLLKKDHKFTKAQTLTAGQKIRLRISPWKGQQKYKRAELFSLDRFDLEVFWGEY